MRIRLADLRDVDDLVEFNATMAWETEGKRLETRTLRAGVKAVLERDDLGFYVVTESDNQVVGGLLVTYEWSDWRNGRFWWIQSVFVRDAFRRQGVYRRMYEFVQKQAEDQVPSVCGFRLYVERDNQVAQAAYVNLNMKELRYRMFEAPATNRHS